MNHYTLGYKTDLISEIRARESTHPDCNLTSPPRKKNVLPIKKYFDVTLVPFTDRKWNINFRI